MEENRPCSGSRLPSAVSPDAACDSDLISHQWAGRCDVVEPRKDNDSGVQSLGWELGDLHVTSFEAKRPRKRHDSKESKRQCYDSGISLSVDLSHKSCESTGEYKLPKDDTVGNTTKVAETPVISAFVSRDKSELFKRNDEGDTPLHLFIIYELLQWIGQILDLAPAPGQLNMVNDMQQTPLIIAALTKQARIVRELVIAGADYLLPDRHGDTALHVASRNGDLDTVKALTKPITPQELRRTESNERTRNFRQNLNAKNYDGFAPVHLAAMAGHVDTLTYLVNLGADVDEMEAKSGLRPLHFAILNEDRETIRRLVETCQADIDAPTFYGLSPIELANERRLYDVVVYLVNFGADRTDIDVPEMIDSDEDTDEEIEIEFADLRINGVLVYK